MKTNQHFLRNSYLFLSFLSSLIELGPVVLLLTNDSILYALYAGLCYQVGNLIAGAIRVSGRILVGVTLIGCVCSIFSKDYSLAFYMSVILGSIALQGFRRLITSESNLSVSTFTKRLSRIAGFAVAGLFSYWANIAVLLVILILGVIIVRKIGSSHRPLVLSNIPLQTPIALVMVIHQSHYFSYAYILPALLLLRLLIPVPLVGLFFIVGWISYIATEKLVRSQRYILIVFIGHILVALSLSVLGYFQSSAISVMLSWFMSGLGGGTVYCLTRINKQLALSHHTEIEFWEDVGHVSGVVLSIIFAVFLFSNPFHAFFGSAIVAVITALGIVLSGDWIRKNSIPTSTTMHT